jgi:shikimate kinase
MSLPVLHGRALVLVGYRGTGKSTVGRILAGRLARRFIDADLAFERSTGGSIRAFFEEFGEVAFRDKEAELLASFALSGVDFVLATGGGVILRESNRQLLRRFARTAWLAAAPEILADRLRSDPESHKTRPPLTDAGTIGEIAQLLLHRDALYREVADVSIDTSHLTVEQVADLVLDRLADLPSF